MDKGRLVFLKLVNDLYEQMKLFWRVVVNETRMKEYK